MTSFFLIGPMGSGKTSVGRQLARKLKLSFYDSDREIESRCGVDIPTIFEYEGEQGFRDRESTILEELTAMPNIVLATGGGSVLREENRTLLAERGYVVLLSVELKEQLRRVSLNNNRPLLRDVNPEQRLREIMQEREPLYRELADVTINTNGGRMQNVITRLTRHINQEKLLPS